MAARLKAAVALSLPWLALLGCGSETGYSGACAVAIRLEGARYVAQRSLDVPVGAEVGQAVTASCEGQFGGRRVTVRRFGDVPPALAVAVAVDGEPGGYHAEGYLPVLRGHPLHRHMYGSDDRPAPRRRGCGRSFRWDGVVVVTPETGNELVVRRFGRRRTTFLDLHARTRVHGFSRSGFPYLARGDRVRVSGRICRPYDRDLLRGDVIGPIPSGSVSATPSENGV